MFSPDRNFGDCVATVDRLLYIVCSSFGSSTDNIVLTALDASNA